MKLIVCVDKNNGLSFNHRRQSRDRVVTQDIARTFGAMLERGATSFWETARGQLDFSRAGSLMEIPAETDAAELCADYLSGDYLRQIRVRSRVETDVARFIAASGLEKTLMRPRSPFLQAVFRAVRGQLRSSLTIAEIARTLSVSESALTKRFRSEFGMPLGRYIDEMLAQEIASRLLSTQQSVRDISEQLGFCDQFYLSRFFSAHRGMSPSAYRASLQEQI